MASRIGTGVSLERYTKRLKQSFSVEQASVQNASRLANPQVSPAFQDLLTAKMGRHP
jgi:hypothetical protein